MKANPKDVKVNATPSMCFYCFDVLQYELRKEREKNRSPPSPEPVGKGKNKKKRKSPSLVAPNPELYSIPDVECPLFVGWKKGKNGGGAHKLRGCKGTHGYLPLNEGLKQYAILSAFEDTRFSQIREEELPRLTCSVSLLHGFEKVSDCYDWEVGIHGIRIDFYDNENVQRSATFLPHVASQFGYTQKQTIERLVEKAGTDDRVDKKYAQRIKTTRFQASLCDVAHDDWAKSRGGGKKK